MSIAHFSSAIAAAAVAISAHDMVSVGSLPDEPGYTPGFTTGYKDVGNFGSIDPTKITGLDGSFISDLWTALVPPVVGYDLVLRIQSPTTLVQSSFDQLAVNNQDSGSSSQWTVATSAAVFALVAASTWEWKWINFRSLGFDIVFPNYSVIFTAA